ncbi:MAG: hypothetical protein Q8M98_09930 [Candidatus Cloacimonadaceae bacterium]|nr:hypothetical protein [Candidatus Cloacimonadaceae bacterium]
MIVFILFFVAILEFIYIFIASYKSKQHKEDMLYAERWYLNTVTSLKEAAQREASAAEHRLESATELTLQHESKMSILEKYIENLKNIIKTAQETSASEQAALAKAIADTRRVAEELDQTNGELNRANNRVFKLLQGSKHLAAALEAKEERIRLSRQRLEAVLAEHRAGRTRSDAHTKSLENIVEQSRLQIKQLEQQNESLAAEISKIYDNYAFQMAKLHMPADKINETQENIKNNVRRQLDSAALPSDTAKIDTAKIDDACNS